MKTKKFLAIKVLCFTLSGLLLSSSVFVSGAKSLTVFASTVDDDTDQGKNFARALVTAISAIIGLGVLKSGTAFTICETIGLSLVEGVDYFNNDDGTVTITATGIQKVNEIICNDYIDGQVEPDENGLYNYGAFNIKFHIEYSGTVVDREFNATAFNCKYPLALVIDTSNSESKVYGFNSETGSVGYYDGLVDSISTVKGSSTWYEIGTYYTEKTVSGSTSLSNVYKMAPFTVDGQTEFSLTYSVPFPVFSDVTTAKNALISGDYTDAINYRAKIFEVSSRFTGLPYTGGDVTISATKLDGIEEKLDELNAFEKSTDEKVEEIVDWLYESDNSSGGGSVSGGDSGGSDSGSDSGGGFLSSLGDFIGKIFDFILSLIEMLFDPIIQLLDMFMELINKVIDIIPTGFTSFLGAMFPFFPEEWVTIISLGLLIVILVSILRRK